MTTAPKIRFIPLPTDDIRRLQRGGPDAYGARPENAISDGQGIPCRHCLTRLPAGEPYLIVAHRPFSGLQPYAETGPLFLCARECEAADPGDSLPGMLTASHYIVRGYSADERIAYGTGGVVPTGQIRERAAEILSDPKIAFVDVRSSSNNCFLVRVARA
ncbi:MAG: DUF1203 domain-containing protein [Alphaproteobacteria bacterium]|nr:DUF1203 domain-containing protein [Alphaproteobacteria bacterium]